MKYLEKKIVLLRIRVLEANRIHEDFEKRDARIDELIEETLKQVIQDTEAKCTHQFMEPYKVNEE